MKAHNSRFSFLQLERDLNLFMHFHVVWFVADTVHDMEFDELFAPAYEEGKRLICIETDRGSCLRNETLKVLERTDTNKKARLATGLYYFIPVQKKNGKNGNGAGR